MIREEYKIDVEIEKFDEFKIDRSLDSSKFREATGFRPPGWKELVGMMANDPLPYNDWK